MLSGGDRNQFAHFVEAINTFKGEKLSDRPLLQNNHDLVPHRLIRGIVLIIR